MILRFVSSGNKAREKSHALRDVRYIDKIASESKLSRAILSIYLPRELRSHGFISLASNLRQAKL